MARFYRCDRCKCEIPQYDENPVLGDITGPEAQIITRVSGTSLLKFRQDELQVLVLVHKNNVPTDLCRDCLTDIIHGRGLVLSFEPGCNCGFQNPHHEECPEFAGNKLSIKRR